MAADNMKRLSKVARELNVGKDTIVDYLATKGVDIENNPNTKISPEQFNMLSKEFASSAQEKKEASGLTIGKKRSENIVIENAESEASESKGKDEEEEKVLIKNVSDKKSSAPSEKEEKPKEKEKEKEEEGAPVSSPKLQGPKVLGKIDLDKPKKSEQPEAKKQEPAKAESKESEKPAASEKSEPKKTPTPAPEQKKPTTKPEVSDTQKKEKAQAEKIEEEKKEQKEKQAPAKAEKQVKKKKPATPKAKTPEAADKEQTAEAKKESKPTKKTEREAEVDVTMEKPVEREKAKKERTSEQEGEASKGIEPELISAKADQLKGLTVLGKIDLPEKKKKKAKPVASSDEKKEKRKKRPRKRIAKPGTDKPAGQQGTGTGAGAGARGPRPGGPARRGEGGPSRFKGKGKRPQGGKPAPKEELTDKQIQEQIKQTLARLSGGGKKGGSKSSRSKYRKEKRSAIAGAREEEMLKAQQEAKTLRVTEFISANDLASLMEVTVNDVISACMSMGMFVSINQRLDAEAITLIADEFGYDVDFSTTEEEMVVEIEEDKPEDLKNRAPIVTIMGHVDHGKTSLLDYIRSAKVASGEAGGITQHIGAYDVETESGKRIAFLDTPGHEAFTAMRARGAKVTDVAIIVVAADDDVMPQTREAINHAQVAGVPIVIAINKVDKPTANPEKIKEALSQENILVEDWGGKYQCQEISAKTGQGIDDLLEKVLLESEMLELTSNPDKKADGTVIEASLDKGRGYVSTFLVQNGTLNVGDTVLAGAHYGKVKALFDHRGNRVEKAGPATPVLMLGLDGAPQAGDRFNVMDSDREAREMANKRQQILREQSVRTKKHITLDEIGRRLAVGNFKELNIILKGDVDGSVEALSDSLLKLSTEEVQVNIIHKAVGQITESDVLLASASDAIIIGFQVRPSVSARRIAEGEEIEIRLYSIIYNAIEEVKDAMEGMLAPTVEEVIVGNAEIRDVFKISKIGTVAGCYVTDGYIKRNHQIRLIRDGIVVYAGAIGQLKRFKDDVNEVKQSYECGMSIQNFNDLKVGDVIEAFEEREIKRTL